MGKTKATRRDHNMRRLIQSVSAASADAVNGAASDPSPGAGAATDATRHLTAEAMANLVIAAGDADESKALRHLLAVCSVCRHQFESLKAKNRDLRHWNLSLVLLEEEAAPGLWHGLASVPYNRQLAAVRADPSYQTWGFSLFLVRRSASFAAEQPNCAGQLANLGLAVAEALDPAYDEDWIEDLAALALASLGNARREMGELAAANDAFDQARERRAAGTESPAIEAEVLALEAVLRRDERNLDAAVGLLGRVYEICTERDETDEEAYDLHLGGAALVQQAWCLYHLGRLDEALATLDQAENLLDSNRDPSLQLTLRSGRLRCLLSLGQGDAAPAALAEALQVAAKLGDRPAQLRLRLAEARMIAKKEPAERILREAAAGFLELDQGIDAALAFMELARLLIDDPEKVRPLGNDLLPAWSSPEIKRFDNIALLLFQQACEADRVTSALVEQLACFLERERRPSLSWWSAWGAVLEGERSPCP